MKNVCMKAIEVNHPDYIESSETHIELFKKKGRDISNLLKATGRKRSYRIKDRQENGLTMAIQAAKKVLAKAGLKGTDIDMIVYSSQVPEYHFPTNAIFVHEAVGGKKDCIVYDNNANCAGMTIAVEQVSRYMMSTPHVHRALVVGSDYLTLVANPEEEMTYANFGDASCAVILEKTDEETGFIDAIYETDSSFKNYILYPEKGFSNYAKNQTFTGYIKWHPFDGTVALPHAYIKIEKLLHRNHFSIEDVQAFCFSQFAWVNIERLQAHFHIPSEKIVYVGDRYGYTGTSSPFIALYEGIQQKRIKRGDLLLFWTIGGGHEFIAMLYRY